jgi:YihY family inner membrane protein
VTKPVPRVPDAGEHTAGDAWRAVRGARWSFWKKAFARFRYGDGFSHSRALALQLSLAFIPLVIATAGLSGTLSTDGLGRVLRRTLIALSPGGSGELIGDTLEREEGSGAALLLGLAFAVATLTTAMGQVERGANRIYGIERDRPSWRKYGRALGMAVVAGLPGMGGSGVLLAGSAFGDAVEHVYGWDDDAVTAVSVPLGTLMVVFSVMAMLRLSPRRRQPGWLWLGLGAAITVALWLTFTGLLAAYVQLSASFGVVYGPLTGVIALLLWTQLTSVAILFGVAVTAQLEAGHVGIRHGAVPDPELPRSDRS